MTNFFVLLLLLSLSGLIWGFVAPHHIAKAVKAKQPVTRVHTGVGFGVLTLVMLIAVGVTTPTPSTQAKDNSILTSNKATTSTTTGQTSSGQPAAKQPVITTKQVSETHPVAFTTVTKDDATLSAGQTKVTQEGKDGVETFVYTVTYTDGIESHRALASQSVTTQPTQKIIANGTYVAPASSSSGSGYTNVDGNHVASPSSDPTGASAQCRDGSYSYSQHRSGTCSSHGSVSRWL